MAVQPCLPVLLQHPRERQAQPRAQHHHVAVREVDELQDAVHHRVAQRHERVQAANGDAGLQGLKENFHAGVKGTPQAYGS
jgi:hypothetical protein